MPSFLIKQAARTVVFRVGTVAVMIAMQVLLTLACVLLLRNNWRLDELVEIYRQRSAPLAGREVPPISGVDRTGAERTIEYGSDNRPTLIYAFSEGCGACKKNWPVFQEIQKLSPDRIRIVYLNPYDQLTDDYLLEHRLAEDVLFTKLEQFSQVSYQIRGTPQSELVGKDGRVLWTALGAYRPKDFDALVEAIEKHEQKSTENQGAER